MPAKYMGQVHNNSHLFLKTTCPRSSVQLSWPSQNKSWNSRWCNKFLYYIRSLVLNFFIIHICNNNLTIHDVKQMQDAWSMISWSTEFHVRSHLLYMFVHHNGVCDICNTRFVWNMLQEVFLGSPRAHKQFHSHIL